MVQTPNHQPASTPELTPEERDTVNVAHLNEWRTYQYQQLHETKFPGGEYNSNWADDFDQSHDGSLDAFLASKGIDDSSPNHSQIRALFNEASINNISEDEWGNSPASRGEDANDHQSRSDKFAERICQEFSSDDDATEPQLNLTPEQIQKRDKKFEELDKKLEELREELAISSAKRQGKMFSGSTKKHDELQKQYFTKLQELGKLHLAQHPDYSDEEKKLITTSVLFDEQEKLRESTISKYEDTKTTKMVRWMNKGSRWQRIARGAAVGAAAGVGGTFLAGAVGAGIVTGSVLLASRFARGFALQDGNRGMHSYEDTIEVTEQSLNSESNSSYSNDDQRINHLSYLIGDQKDFEKSIRTEQSKHRKAAAIGSIAIAAGAGAGSALYNGVEWLAGKI